MVSPLVLKLEQFVRFSADDVAALQDLERSSTKVCGPREDIIKEGDRPTVVNLILEGWACRYKMLEDGRRQITALFVPGDLCDIHVFILREMDHSIGALIKVRVAQIPREELERLTAERPRVTQALWWEGLVSASIQREWILNLGQRNAIERVSHLFCEIYYRLRGVGQAQDGQFEMPFSQTDLAETTGMTPVHLNRTVQDLRARGLIVWKGKRFHIVDLPGLINIAMFNENYLHFRHEGAVLDARRNT
ncbi:Crp/Fnr family transcriptional regulator [Mangrovicella endophytica]|uniref:Crp/Fnr family transcriptional regulator n=1 Tax=Mangrovicella endophytica TaxID=2066697 RepID=UPI000C9EC12A|nr:Crp/Fnr family transcriptional regulator [Mangrovicella endophytica]